MTIHIRAATEPDVWEIVRMMRDFAEFEKLLDHFLVSPDKLAAAMFGRGRFVDGLIAENDGQPIGYAIYYPYFASFSGQTGLYLEDIYIEQSYRGRGIGESILRQLAHTAKSRGCERIDFQVLDWNTPAVRFYLKLGAVRNEDERHFKFAGDAFELLATQLES